MREITAARKRGDVKTLLGFYTSDNGIHCQEAARALARLGQLPENALEHTNLGVQSIALQEEASEVLVSLFPTVDEQRKNKIRRILKKRGEEMLITEAGDWAAVKEWVESPTGFTNSVLCPNCGGLVGKGQFKYRSYRCPCGWHWGQRQEVRIIQGTGREHPNFDEIGFTPGRETITVLRTRTSNPLWITDEEAMRRLS